MSIGYERRDGVGRWTVGWDGPGTLRIGRDILIVVACLRYLGVI